MSGVVAGGGGELLSAKSMTGLRGGWSGVAGGPGVLFGAGWASSGDALRSRGERERSERVGGGGEASRSGWSMGSAGSLYEELSPMAKPLRLSHSRIAVSAMACCEKGST